MNDTLVPARFSLPADWPETVSFVFEQADLVVSTLTLQSRVQKNAYAWLEQAAREVNQVWNHANAATFKAWHGRYGGQQKWLSAFEVSDLFTGCGEVFEKIGIDTAQSVVAEHAVRRSQFSRSKLNWRKSGGSRRSLGWVPFKAPNLRFSLEDAHGKRVVLKGDKQPVVPAWPKKGEQESTEDYKARRAAFAPVRAQAEMALQAWEYRRVQAAAKISIGFMGKSIRVFNANRLVEAYKLACQGVGQLRAGNFSQDAVGDWYLNVVVDKVELQLAPVFGPDSSIGMDPGQTNSMTGSDGRKLRSRRYREMEPKIQQAQKHAHPGQAKRFNRKAKRQRLDDRNKFCRDVVGDYARVWVGDLSPKKMAKSKLKGQAKSVHDAAPGAAYSTLEAMGHRAGRVVGKVNERNSTRSCSNCQALTGPAGLDGCVVRHWACAACGAAHDRDQNSGENLRHAGETGWQNRLLGLEKRATPRYWRPFAGTR